MELGNIHTLWYKCIRHRVLPRAVWMRRCWSSYQATRAHHDIPLYAACVVCMLFGGSSVADADGMGCTRCVTALNVLNKHKDKLGRLDRARIEKAQQNQFPGKVYQVQCTIQSCNKHECNGQRRAAP